MFYHLFIMVDNVQRDRAERKNSWLYGLMVLILVFGLAVLIYLERQIVSDRRIAFENAATLLNRERVLKNPDNVRISSDGLKTLAATIRKNPFIKDIYVSKIIAGRGEHVVFPFHYETLLPPRKKNLKRLIRAPLEENGNVWGYLYIEPNNNIIVSVRAAAAAFSLLLILSLVAFYRRVHTQERVITETSFALDERRRELIRLERLALAGMLTANILHDIKKPVLNIKQEAQDMERQPDEKTARAAARSIQEQVELFFNILRDLGLERFVKAREGGEEFVDVNEILERACRLVRYECGSSEVVFDLAEKLPALLARPTRLIQLFSNLILNAFQAMKGSGKLAIRTAFQDGAIHVEITDTGPGIPPELIKKIFNPFFSTRSGETGGEEGSGLGLFISKNIVDDMKGELRVESSPGKGAKFAIVLPVHFQNEKEAQKI